VDREFLRIKQIDFLMVLELGGQVNPLVIGLDGISISVTHFQEFSDQTALSIFPDLALMAK